MTSVYDRPVPLDLRARAANGFRDHVLYSTERHRRFSRSGARELARNVAVAFGRSTLFGHPVQFAHRGFVIPCDLAEMTGGGADTWDAITDAHLEYYRRWAPITPSSSVLEIGCGIGRDAMALGEVLVAPGRYVGLDITRPSIAWCNAHIARRYPSTSFAHLDVQSDMYNPRGAASSTDVRLPVEADAFDLVVLHSVFTHMFHDAIAHYLDEIRRALRPGGQVMASFFLVDDDALAAAARHEAPLTFTQLHAGCDRVNDASHPEAAVGFRTSTVDALASAAGLIVRDIHRGFWSGQHAGVPNGQDIVMLGKPVAP